MKKQDHEYWMRRAIHLAQSSWGRTHPNPMVGSILVHENEIITSGFHERAGAFHAERAALTGFTLTEEQQQEATLYVTLEPCCTHGRTPPCTEIIIEKGIQNVVIGALDPNPKHQGKGIDILKNAGVKVKTDVLGGECADLNLIFNHCMLKQSPFIALKSAMTLDGKIATESGYSKWITSNEARENVMHWREYFPGIGVGAGTVLADDPSLTIRREGRVIGCPVRLIFDRSLRTLPEINKLNVFNDDWADHTVLITCKSHGQEKLNLYRNKNCRVCEFDYEESHFPINEFKQWCWEKEISGVYIEGGPAVSSSFLNQEGADYLFAYHAPKLFISQKAPEMFTGGKVKTPNEAPYIESPIYEQFGNDMLTRGHLCYPR